MFFLLSFILYEVIMLIHAKKSYFPYKSLIKASRLLIFGTYIFFYILSNCALNNSVSNFFLMYFIV